MSVQEQLFDVRGVRAIVTGAASGLGLATVLLASPASSFMTGGAYPIDGGTLVQAGA